MDNSFKRGISTKDSLGIGSIQSEFISPEHIEVIKLLFKKDPTIILVGSIGLIINGLLKREAKDIDIVTPENYFHHPFLFFWDQRNDPESQHMNFKMGDKHIVCHGLDFDEIRVDVFHKIAVDPMDHKFTIKGFYGGNIRIGDPQEAIDAKLDYISKISNVQKVNKHIIDLLEMGIDRKQIVEALKKNISAEEEFENNNDLDFIF